MSVVLILVRLAPMQRYRPATHLSVLLRIASAVANFFGKGRPKTFGAVSSTSVIQA